MNKRTIITCWALLLPLLAIALPVTFQQAQQQAAAFMASKGLSLEPGATVNIPSRVPANPQGEAPYFIFKGKAGYVIISGDDRTEPVLGYSERGTIDEDNLPEGLQWLLQLYADQIALLDATVPVNATETPDAALPGESARASQVRRQIPPLLKTLWNQGDPYNLLCPPYYHDDGTPGGLSATGCVATAIAQVMSFYRYPHQTKRLIPGYRKTFNTTDGEKSVLLRNIPAGSVIDWDNILDEYHGNETEAEKQAIAQLMLWVGMGCKMDYAGSSGAGFPEGVNALINYFGYDDGTRIESRGNYTAKGWTDLLYNELFTGHPIAFAGTNTGGAHAFVLDGYDIDGLFHVNWGWGGLDNGYFRIDVLAPDDNSGIGASITPDAYNMGQDAIIGMRLPDDITAPATVYQLTVNDWEIRNGNTFFANYVNWSGISAEWNMGIGYVNDEGNIVLVGSYRTQQLGKDTYTGMEFPVRGLQAGTYHIVPVSKRTTDREWHTRVNPEISYILADVDGEGNVTLSKHPVEQITMSGISFPGNLKRGERQPVTATFKNHGDEYLREILLFASPTADKGQCVCRTNVGIPVDGETTASFSFTPNQSGTWNIWLATDYDCRNIVGSGSVEITDNGVAVNRNLRYVSHTMGNRSNGVIFGDKMQGKVTILNQNSSAFDGKVRLWLHKLASNGYYYGVSSIYANLHIEPGKTAQTAYFFDNLELGVTYALSILYDGGGDIQDGGLRQMGRTQAGVIYWQQNMNLGGMVATNTVTTPSSAVVLDMRSIPNSVTTVITNGNPNTLYLFAEGATRPEGLDSANVVIGNQAERIVLKDGYGFYAPLTFTALSATYTRPSASGGWETVVLPYAVNSLPDGLEVQEFSWVDDAGEVMFAPVDRMDGNIPYLMKRAEGGPLVLSAEHTVFPSAAQLPMTVGTTDYQFCGTTVRRQLSDVLVLNEEATAFVAAPGMTLVDAFRAYFTAPDGVDTIAVPTAATAICLPETSANSESVFYDLQGRRVKTPGRGIYIRNHRKVVIR